jgi:hypothetical protein
MVHEIELLLRRGFNVISLMVDPFGTAKEPYEDVDIFISLTHNDFSGILRFLARCEGFPAVCEMITRIIDIYDNHTGEAWRLPNSRVALNTLKTNKLYMQGTSHGLKFARDTLGLSINESR